MFETRYIAQIGYFFTTLCVGTFLFVSVHTQTYAFLHEMIFLFALLLLPLLDIIYDSLFQNKSWRKCIPSNITFSQIFTFLGFLCLLFVVWFRQEEIYIVSLMIFFIFQRWDARVFFAGALLTLCFVMYQLLLQKNLEAQELTIVFYYLLLAGVIVQVTQRSSLTHLS